MLHEKGIMRIQTDIRVGSRYVVDSAMVTLQGGSIVWGLLVCHTLTGISSSIDKKQTFSDKVTAVNKLLAADHKSDQH